MCYKQRLLWVAIFIVWSSYVKCEILNSNNVKEQIIQQFNEYNADVSSGSNAKLLSRYFSKDLNEEWLGWLLSDDSIEMLMQSQKSINSRLRFSRWIVNIYKCNIKKKEDHTWTLTIIYDSVFGRQKEAYEIDYTLSGSRWYISSTLADSTDQHVDSTEIIRTIGEMLDLESCVINGVRLD